MIKIIKDQLKKMFDFKDKKTKVIVLIGFVGILLILFSEVGTSWGQKSTKTKSSETNYCEYVENLDKETTDVISSIDGVGNCKVMITLKNTKESIYAENSDKSDGDGSSSQNDEYVIYDGANGDSPILLKENFPEIQGVVVVCSGGDNVEVKEKVINSVSALFNISSNRISVSKISNEG